MNIKYLSLVVLVFISITLVADTNNENVTVLLYPLGWENITQINNAIEKVGKEFSLDNVMRSTRSILETQDYNLTRGFLNISDGTFKYNIASDFLFSNKTISDENIEYIIFIKPKANEVYKEYFTSIYDIMFNFSGIEKIFAPTDGNLFVILSNKSRLFCQYYFGDYRIDISSFSNNNLIKTSYSNLGDVIGETTNKTLTFSIRDIDSKKLTNVVYLIISSIY